MTTNIFAAMKEDQSHAFPREGGRVELDARNNLLGGQEKTGGDGEEVGRGTRKRRDLAGDWREGG